MVAKVFCMKVEMKIELEHNPEKLLQECLVYMLSYKE